MSTQRKSMIIGVIFAVILALVILYSQGMLGNAPTP
jgi:hypothetical protein